MNLVIDPWIPVVTIDGKPDFANLMKIFTEGEKFADFSVRPHERVALMRLLICIAQAALDGPVDKDDWMNAPKKLPEATRVYLEKWNKEEVFELFHKEKPFLQIKDLQSDNLTPLNYMEVSLTLNGNPTLFNCFTEYKSTGKFTDRQLALILPTFLCFSTGGGLPITTWGAKKTHQTNGNKDAPCVAGSMYHLFMRGNNIFETITLNILTRSTIQRFYGPKVSKDFWGVPVWEHYPSAYNDEDAIRNATETYIGRLTPISRWVKIEKNVNGMHCGNGFPYPTMEKKIERVKKHQKPVPPWPAEPTATVILRKNERILMGVKPSEPDKALWRELAALMVYRNQNSIGGPLVLDNPINNEHYDVLVCALHRKSGQQAVENLVESVYSISKKILNGRGRKVYENGIEDAELKAYFLCNAIETYRQNVDGYWEQRKKSSSSPATLRTIMQAKATRSYWTAIEKKRSLLMAYVDTIDDDAKFTEAQSDWRNAIHNAALDAYITTCGQETPRQIRAFALGYKKLFMVKKIETEDKEQDIDGGEE